MFRCSFKIGQTVSNAELRAEFSCGNMGGMRKSNTTNTLSVITDHTRGLYEDKWLGDVLHYTGMGLSGDQSLTFLQNKTLAESATNGIGVHLFEVLIPCEYIYHGPVSLAGAPYQEEQAGKDGLLRQVWMFPLRVKRSKLAIPAPLLERNVAGKERQAKRLRTDELKHRARENESEVVSNRQIISNVYLRDPYVAEYAKRRAEGKCQLCREEAPFHTRDGRPYLECHHITWISAGGSDTIDNTVALCPNCHRKMHALNLEADKNSLRALLFNE